MLDLRVNSKVTIINMTRLYNISTKLLRTVFLCVAVAAYAMPANAVMSGMDMSEAIQSENTVMNSHCDTLQSEQQNEENCADCCDDGNCGCQWFSSATFLMLSNNQSHQTTFHLDVGESKNSIPHSLSTNTPNPPPIS